MVGASRAKVIVNLLLLWHFNVQSTSTFTILRLIIYHKTVLIRWLNNTFILSNLFETTKTRQYCSKCTQVWVYNSVQGFLVLRTPPTTEVLIIYISFNCNYFRLIWLDWMSYYRLWAHFMQDLHQSPLSSCLGLRFGLMRNPICVLSTWFAWQLSTSFEQTQCNSY